MIVALLTGRGNNSMKDKNVIKILGHPVLFYPAKAAKEAHCINDWFVSSDDIKILSAACELGYRQILRPKDLSLSSTQHYEVLLHALQEITNSLGIMPEILICLLANNVTIKKEWIEDCVNLLQQDLTLSSVVPVYQDMDHHPLRAKQMNSNGLLSSFFSGMETEKISTNRQDLEPCYYLSHNFWVMRVKDSLLKNDGEGPWSFMGKKVKGYVIKESIDIHDRNDLIMAENWILNHCKAK